MCEVVHTLQSLYALTAFILRCTITHVHYVSQVMEKWFSAHRDNPYPSEEEKRVLISERVHASVLGLTCMCTCCQMGAVSALQQRTVCGSVHATPCTKKENVATGACRQGKHQRRTSEKLVCQHPQALLASINVKSMNNKVQGDRKATAPSDHVAYLHAYRRSS